MRAVVTTPVAGAHVLGDAEQFERIECLLSRETPRPTIGEVRRAVLYLSRRQREMVRPLLEAKGYGEALS